MKSLFRQNFIATLLALSTSINAATPAANLTTKADSWFLSDEGRKTVECILSWQSERGDWPKNTDTSKREFSGDRSKLKGTFDNGATTGELRILARAFRATNDVRYKRSNTEPNLTKNPSAPPLWARFYEIKSNRPFFCDRDGVVKYDVEEIGGERRKGYSWYSNAGEKVAKACAKWPHR